MTEETHFYFLDIQESYKDKKIEQIFEWKQGIPAALVDDFALQVA